MSDNEETELQPLTSRFAELWGDQAAAVTLLGTVIRVAEGAIFKEDLGEELKRIKALAEEGLSTLEEESKPEPGFGFTKE